MFKRKRGIPGGSPRIKRARKNVFGKAIAGRVDSASPPDGKPAVPDGRLKKPLRSGAGLSAEEKEKEGGAPTRQRWAARLLGRGREEKGPGETGLAGCGVLPLFFHFFSFQIFSKRVLSKE